MSPRIDPRQMKRMMRQLGVQTEEMEGVEEVRILTSEKEYIFKRPEVTMTVVQGQKTFQLVGEPEIREREGAIPEEDIKLVMEQTGADYEEAKKALEENDGEPAEAIIAIMSKRG